MLVFVVLCFNLENEGEGLGMEPWRWEDVCAALALEKEREPEGEGGAARRLERFDGALRREYVSYMWWEYSLC